MGDSSETVARNRELLSDLTGPIQFMNQVHGDEVVEVKSLMDDPTCDALITREPGIALAVMVADCIPLLLSSSTVVAAGFEGGEPRKVVTPVIDAATLGGVANPIPSNDPISVALDLDSESTPRRRVTFEELVAEDEIDVPDFMK